MSGPTVAALCARVRPELASLGDAGTPLVAVLGVVEQAGAGRSCDILADPGFALEVLAGAGPGADAALVGRVLDFLRARSNGSIAEDGGGTAAAVRLVDAVASYETGALALMDNGTIRPYRTWMRRLTDAHPDADPAAITAGDLTDLIATHVVAARAAAGGTRRAGLCAQEHAVHAYRHMWRYFVQKGWVPEISSVEGRAPSQRKPRPLSRSHSRGVAHGSPGGAAGSPAAPPTSPQAADLHQAQPDAPNGAPSPRGCPPSPPPT